CGALRAETPRGEAEGLQRRTVGRVRVVDDEEKAFVAVEIVAELNQMRADLEGAVRGIGEVACAGLSAAAAQELIDETEVDVRLVVRSRGPQHGVRPLGRDARHEL